MIYAPISKLPSFLPDLKPLHDYISTLDENSPIGRHGIDGDSIYSAIAEYDTKTPEDAVLESHREYTDIQIVLSGRELGRIAPCDGLEIISDAPAKDLILYRKPAKFAAEFIMDGSVFAIFLPYDTHCTQIMIGNERKTTKKAVIKVRKNIFKDFFRIHA
jgi:YhcH/YjgK/YiaL family protein